jgi:hypothetical protein
MSRVQPLSEEKQAVLQHRFEQGPLAHRPLLEQIVLGVHPGGDFMSSALEHNAACGRKVDADVRAVQLLLDDERGISDEVQRLLLREPNRCGVRGYFVKLSRDAPMTAILRAVSLHLFR